ncbi:TetR/AcrR family transcriptional regulator [Slackia piriformis]|uniref:TetR/AcrR family transcriptional regulator n=1 Tax=Slackia piriformis TaxID=626934 RepID=UPI003709A3AC
MAQEKDYGKITISELAREADVDRKTFYLHYSSIEDMIDDRVGELVGGILDEVELDMQRRLQDCESEEGSESVKPDARVFFAGVNGAVKIFFRRLRGFLAACPSTLPSTESASRSPRKSNAAKPSRFPCRTRCFKYTSRLWSASFSVRTGHGSKEAWRCRSRISSTCQAG